MDKKAWTFYGLVLLVAIYLFFCNYFFPMISDDYILAFVWDAAHKGNFFNLSGREWELIDDFGDVIHSVVALYQSWGGRIVGWGGSEIAILMGAVWFDVLNTFFAVLLFVLMYVLAGGSLAHGRQDALLLLMLFAGFWMADAGFLNNMLWLSGATVYLWPGILQLLWLLPWMQIVRGNRLIQSQYLRFGFVASYFLLGFFAGNSNENMSPVLLLVGGYLYWREKVKRQKWMVYGLLGMLLGLFVLLLAPGNACRWTAMQEYGIGGSFWSFPDKLFALFIFCLIGSLYFCFSLPLFSSCHSTASEQETKQCIFLAKVYFVIGALSAVFMLAAPMIAPRTLFGFAAFFSMGGAMAWNLFWKSKIVCYHRSFLKLWTAIMIACAFVTCTTNFIYEERIHVAFSEMKAQMTKHEGEDFVMPAREFLPFRQELWIKEGVVPFHVRFGRFFGLPLKDTEDAMNVTMARYYHLKSFRLEVASSQDDSE